MLCTLPDELILAITEFLKDEDYISLSNANRRLLNLLASEKRILNLTSSYNVDINCLHSFFEFSGKLEIVQSLDLSHCYWLEPELLTHLITSLSTSLISLNVIGTGLDSSFLVQILQKCPLIRELSASFSSSDPHFWQSSKGEPEVDARISDCIFEPLSTQLAQLSSLDLHGDVNAFHIITVFLSFCPNLEKLSLTELGQPQCFAEPGEGTTAADRATNRGLSLRRVERWVEEYFCLLPSTYPSLKRLSCRSHAVGDLTAHSFLYYLVGRILQSPSHLLEVLWFPHVCVDEFLRAVGQQPRALHVTYESPELLDQARDRSLLTSLCIDGWYNRTEHGPFMSELSSGKIPPLKLASLCYDSEYFFEFARNNRELRILQLQTSSPPGPNLLDEIGCFSKLTKFSVDPNFFHAAGFYGEEEASVLETAVKQLVNGCPGLNEIEIGIFPIPRCDNPITTATSSCLGLFSRCALLQKLTLANLKVDNLDFLSLILTRCSRLGSLRLTNIKHGYLIPEIVKQLNVALPSAKCLEDFRWEVGQSGRGKFVLDQTNKPTGSTSQVLGTNVMAALQKAPALRRLSILADCKVIIELCQDEFHFPRLILAALISPVLQADSNIFFRSCHPAFCHYVGPSKAEAAVRLPPLHYNQMVLFESEVTSSPCY